jgi:hypothetical protein
MKLAVLAVGVQMLLNQSNSSSMQKVGFHLKTSSWLLLEWLLLMLAAAAIHHKWLRPGTKILFNFCWLGCNAPMQRHGFALQRKL